MVSAITMNQKPRLDFALMQQMNAAKSMPNPVMDQLADQIVAATRVFVEKSHVFRDSVVRGLGTRLDRHNARLDELERRLRQLEGDGQ
jgi:hypothetical protein